jgi:hypothetical protein
MNSDPNKITGAFLGSTAKEIKQFFAGPGSITFGSDYLEFSDYPFEHSIAFTKPIITAGDIINICVNSAPPTVRVGNELLFISAVNKEELAGFAERNKIKCSDRVDLWEFILEPFLDTEFTDARKEFLYCVLEKYEVDRKTVDYLRETVKKQMMKYNFDTMLWEWVSLGASDVLQAMKPKLPSSEFNSFYQQVMDIALRPDSSGDINGLVNPA